MALIGWTVGLDALHSVVPGRPAISVSTAAALVLGGVALGSTVFPARRLTGPRRWIPWCAGIGVALIGAAISIWYSTGQLREAAEGALIDLSSPQTALALMLLGPALALLDTRRPRLLNVAQILAAATVGISSLMVLAHIYGVSSIYAISPTLGMAPTTATALLLLGLGILCARPDQGVMAVFTSDTAGGSMARRILPITILVPIAIGWIRYQGQSAGLYGVEFGIAIFTLANIGITTAVIAATAGLLFKADLQQRQTEEALRRMTERLARSNAELEQFAYSASHDLQEPLRGIEGVMTLLRERSAGRLDPKADEYIAHGVENAERMRAMIDSLLALSRVDRRGAPPAPVDTGALLGQARSVLDIAIRESGARVTAGPLPTVTADRAQLAQVFQNLIANAIKFRRDEPPRVHISATEGDGAWIFSVRDEGIGIEPRYINQLFQPFRRLHTWREHPGTGMGLAICRRIVERHGGRIWIESEPGRGSTFLFTIPEPK